MDKRAEFQEIGKELLTDACDIEATVASYKQLVDDVSEKIQTEGFSKRNLALDNGMALGPQWASDCLSDAYRTVQFIRAIFQAIQQHSDSKGAVHILYAGTGPHATLLLPVLASFSPSKVRATLVEVNPSSMQFLRDFIRETGLSKSIAAFLESDATTIQLSDAYDIVVSETMQHALEREPQVAVFQNLYNQLPQATVFIPEKITVSPLLLHKDGTLDQLLPALLTLEYGTELRKSMDLKITEEMVRAYKFVALDTHIQLFRDICISRGQSGLTAPKILSPIEPHLIGKVMRINYMKGVSSGFEWCFSDGEPPEH